MTDFDVPLTSQGRRRGLGILTGRHDDLYFNDDAADIGASQFRHDVDLIFARNGVAFTVDDNMRVQRLGPPESRRTTADLVPASGDDRLDSLIMDARNRFTSPRLTERRLALEKLWDTFERLKTLEPGSDKKQQIAALLRRVASGEWYERLNAEAHELTLIGNKMQIRHFEINRQDVPAPAVDYLFTRLAAVILYLLRETGRLA